MPIQTPVLCSLCIPTSALAVAKMSSLKTVFQDSAQIATFSMKLSPNGSEYSFPCKPIVIFSTFPLVEKTSSTILVHSNYTHTVLSAMLTTSYIRSSDLLPLTTKPVYPLLTSPYFSHLQPCNPHSPTRVVVFLFVCFV